MNAHLQPSLIRGEKGSSKSSGSGSTSVDAPNTLRSRAKARIIELLGEGKIKGLVDGARSIYLDYTPLQGADQQFNFSGVTWDFRQGLPDQDPLPGFSESETTVSVETQVKKSTGAVVRTIADQNVDAARVVIRIPALAMANRSTGDLLPTSLEYRIERRPFGGGWEPVHSVLISNQKCTSPYQRQHEVRLGMEGFPWDIRVVRVTDDSTTVDLQNETWWESYTLVTEGRFTYPHSALIGIEINAEQFGTGVPSRQYEVFGLEILIPSNYDPYSRTYTGLWDGSFKRDWTNNPAWVLYDILTNDRYGLGEYVGYDVPDKWVLYQIARYCDELIPSGLKNGSGDDILEPRFTFNGVINSRAEAFEVVQMIASTFRGMTFWSAGQVFAAADMPADPVKLVTPANVENGHFNYSGTALKARHSVALVTWNDPNDYGRPAIEVVQNDEMLAKVGWRPIEVQGTGIQSRGQAHRLGRWILDTEQNETETVEYVAGWDHADVFPGEIISIADPRKMAVRAGGRIVSATATRIVLDSPFQTVYGGAYKISVTMPDGVLVTRDVASFDDQEGPGSYLACELAEALPSVPEGGAVFIISGSDAQPRLYRVLQRKETEKNKFTITALLRDPTKFARVEQGLALEPIQYTRPPTTVAKPLNLDLQQSLFYQSGVPHSRVTLSWTPGSDFMSARFRVTAQSPIGFEDFGETSGLSLDIHDPVPGAWTFFVTAISYAGITSRPAELARTVTGWDGQDAPTISNLRTVGGGTSFSGRGASLLWDFTLPTNVVPYAPAFEVRIIDAVTDQVVRVESVQSPFYTYSFENNLADGGPRRSFKFRVTPQSNTGKPGTPVQITVSNPVPATVIPEVRSTFGNIFISVPKPVDQDYAGLLVWVEESETFDPAVTTPVYDGFNNFAVVPAEGGTTYYVRAAAYDEFDKSELNISATYTVTVQSVDIDPPAVPSAPVLSTAIVQSSTGEVSAKIVASVSPSASANFGSFLFQLRETGGTWFSYQSATNSYEWRNLPPGRSYDVRVLAESKNGFQSAPSVSASIVAASKTTGPAAPTLLTAFAGLRTIGLNWVNPADSDLDHVEVWFSTANDRSTASVQKTAGASAALTGLSSATSYYFWVRAVNTSGVAGAFHPANPSAGLAVMTVQAGASDIAANAIVADKIAAGAVTTASMTANSINGDRIQAGTLQANKIAANSITADQLAAGSVSTDQLAANSITTAKIASGSITTEKIAANAITAEKIAADAVTATHISAGAITADKIDAAAITTEKIAAEAVTTENLAANAITADKIAANAITADKIAAGAVSAGSIDIGIGKNLLLNPEAWEDMAGITYSAVGATLSGSPTVRISPDVWAPAGGRSWSFLFSGNPAAPGYLDVGFANYVPAGSQLAMPVIPGQRYEFSVYVQAHRLYTTYAYIQWYGSSGQTLGVSAGTNFNAPGLASVPLNEWARPFVFGVAPAGATAAVAYVRTLFNGQEAPSFLASSAYFAVASAGQVTPSPYSSGGRTVISGGQIIADSITTNKITIGGVTTDRIAPSAVTNSVFSVTPGTVVGGSVGATSINRTSGTYCKLDMSFMVNSGQYVIGEGESRFFHYYRIRRNFGPLETDYYTLNPWRVWNSYSVNWSHMFGGQMFRVQFIDSANVAAGTYTYDIELLNVVYGSNGSGPQIAAQYAPGVSKIVCHVMEFKR